MFIQPKLLGIFYAIIAPVFYGLLPLFWRGVSLPTAHLIGYRCLFTFLSLGVILVITGQWETVTNLSGNIIKKVGKSAIFLAAHLGCFMGAIALGNQVEAAIGMFLAPAATAVCATIFLAEKLNPLKRFCVGISVLAAIIFFYEAHQIPRFAVLIALTWGLYLTERKNVLQEVTNPLAYSWLEQSLIAGVLLLTLNGMTVINSQSLTPVNSQAFLILGLGCILATLASLLQAKASQMIPCSQVGMLGVISPLVQFFLAIFINDQSVTFLQGSAISFLLIAVLLYNCPPLKNRLPQTD